MVHSHLNPFRIFVFLVLSSCFACSRLRMRCISLEFNLSYFVVVDIVEMLKSFRVQNYAHKFLNENNQQRNSEYFDWPERARTGKSHYYFHILRHFSQPSSGKAIYSFMHAHFLYELEHTTHALMRCRCTARRSTDRDCYRLECIHKLVNVNERNMNLNHRTTIDREKEKKTY